MSSVAMSLAEVVMSVQGLPPGLMFQSKGAMANGSNQSGMDGKHLPPEQEAELRAHWTGKGAKRELAIPSVMFYRSFCQAGMDFKNPKKKRSNMSFLLGATLSFQETMIPLGIKTFETYVDWVRIPPGPKGAMVQIGRPRIPEWSCELKLWVDDELWNAADLEQIARHAGKQIGIGANSPRLKGPHGKFVIMDGTFKVLNR